MNNLGIKCKTIKTVLFCICISLCFANKLHSQKKTEIQLDKYINDGDFENAIDLGRKLIVEQPDNSKLNFKMGFCYLSLPLKKKLSIKYFEKAHSNYMETNDFSSDALEAWYYLAKAYHKNYQFDKALQELNQLKNQVKNKELLSAIEDEISQCNNGKKLVNQPVIQQVTNLGSAINSKYSDHSPVLSADESVIIFTSRRNPENIEANKTDGRKEDIYISNFDGNSWSQPKEISNNINTPAHESSIGLSADGQQLLIYTEADNGTISISTLVGDEWSRPVNLGGNINTRYRETSASISPDGNYIYFTSDRPGGFGGLDIYVSAKQGDGSWGKAVNLGKTINTDKDEEGPFIHYDGITLYFSSKGHKTMGGYDIFMSKKNEFGTWSIPENLGYPVNTTEDDVFFTMTADGKRAYFASYREGGNGGTDIYMMGLPEAEEKPLTVVNGIVAVCKSDIPNVLIKLYEKGVDKPIGLYKPNSNTGKYLYILTRGKKYETVFEIGGIEAYRDEFEIESDADFQVIYKKIQLKGKHPCNDFVGIENKENEINNELFISREESDGYTYIENVMFKINSSDHSFFEENLTKLANYIKSNPDIKIEIVGYADTQGPEAYNLSLSKKRSLSVYNFLIKKGVNKSQLIYRGDGIKDQITINNYKDGSYVWQSLPYNRRVEFNILNDPSGKLKINQFKIPKFYDIKQKSLTESDLQKYENLFTIQVGAFSKPVGSNNFPRLQNIQMYFNGKLYYYTVGEFPSEEKAQQELINVIDLGYKDAFTRALGYYFPMNLIKQLSELK